VAGSPFSLESGAWALAVDLSGKYLYLATGIAVISFSIDQTTGAPTQLPPNPSLPSSSRADALGLDPTGKYLYMLDSQGENVFGYPIDASTGALSLIPGGSFALAAPGATVSVGPVTIAVSP
jgi:6-phosphogluconolactonase